MTSALELIGKLHPVVLHVPIVLLLLAGAVEVARWFRESDFTARSSRWLFALGAIGALVSAGTGWLLAAHEHIRSDHQVALAWHRWLGLAVVAVSGVAWLASTRIKNPRPALRAIRLGIALLVIALVLGTGYFGGEMVWGHDWFSPDAS